MVHIFSVFSDGVLVNSDTFSLRSMATSQVAQPVYAPDSLVIRPATLGDAQALSGLITESFHRYSGFKQWLTPLFRLGIYEDLRYRLKSRDNHHICFVACLPVGRSESIVVGTVELNVRYVNAQAIAATKAPYISNLAVTPQYRRLGIARQLLKRCEVQVQRWNYGNIALHVLENNTAGKQLYTQCGYQITQREKTLRSQLFNHPCRLFLQKNLSS